MNGFCQPDVTTMPEYVLRHARPADVPAIVGLIRELAVYEKLEHLMQATPESLAPHLFGPNPVAECLVAEARAATGTPDSPAAVFAFALFFRNFSTFLAKPGLYLEDLYVQPAWRGQGVGKTMLRRLGALAVERGCGRFEWSVLDWNEPAIRFYQHMGATVMPDWRICRVTGDALQAFAQEGQQP
jgi:GNAT superfamily N-acetyltransferase